MKKFLLKLFVITLISLIIAAVIELVCFATDDEFWEKYNEGGKPPKTEQPVGDKGSLTQQLEEGSTVDEIYTKKQSQTHA